MAVWLQHAWGWIHVIKVLEFTEGNVCTPVILFPRLPKEFVGLLLLVIGVMYHTDLWKWYIPFLIIYFSGIFPIFCKIYSYTVRNNKFSHIISTFLYIAALTTANVLYQNCESPTKVHYIICHGVVSLYNGLRVHHYLQSDLHSYHFNVFQLFTESIIIELSPISILQIHNETSPLTETVLLQGITTVILIFMMLNRFKSNNVAKHKHKCILECFYEGKYQLENQEYVKTAGMLAAIQISIHLRKLMYYRVHASLFYLAIAYFAVKTNYITMEIRFLLELGIICTALLAPITAMKIAQFFFVGIFKSTKIIKLLSVTYGILCGGFCVILLESWKESSIVLLTLEREVSLYFDFELVKVLLVITRTLLLISISGFPIGFNILGFLFGWGKGWSRFVGPMAFLVCSLFVLDILYPSIVWTLLCIIAKYYTYPSYIWEYFPLIYYTVVSPLLYYSMYDEWFIQFPQSLVL